MWVVSPNGGLDIRDVQPPVRGVVGDRVVGDAHEGRRPRALVLKDVRLISEDDLVSSTTVRANGDKVSHRAAVVDVGRNGGYRGSAGEGYASGMRGGGQAFMSAAGGVDKIVKQAPVASGSTRYSEYLLIHAS